MIPKQRLSELIEEEKQAARMYKSYGLPEISKDEARHAKILKKMLHHCPVA